jgi:hypothetical protein
MTPARALALLREIAATVSADHPEDVATALETLSQGLDTSPAPVFVGGTAAGLGRKHTPFLKRLAEERHFLQRKNSQYALTEAGLEHLRYPLRNGTATEEEALEREVLQKIQDAAALAPMTVAAATVGLGGTTGTKARLRNALVQAGLIQYGKGQVGLLESGVALVARLPDVRERLEWEGRLEGMRAAVHEARSQLESLAEGLGRHLPDQAAAAADAFEQLANELEQEITNQSVLHALQREMDRQLRRLQDWVVPQGQATGTTPDAALGERHPGE